MAAPTINGTRKTGNSGTTNSCFHVVTLPDDIVAGERLVVMFGVDGGDYAFLDKWYSGNNWRLVTQRSDLSTYRGMVLTKIAEGGGADALRIISEAVEQSSWVSFRVSADAACIQAATASGNSTNSNPPSLALSVGSPTPEVLWIAARVGDSTVVPSAAPTDFANLTTETAPGTSSVSTSIADRALAAATLDPDAFTVATEQWGAFTIGLYDDSSNAPSARVTALGLVVLTSDDDNPPFVPGGQLVIAT